MQHFSSVCYHCLGRKKLYKRAGGYSLTCSSSTALVDCPICIGVGKVTTKLETKLEPEALSSKVTEPSKVTKQISKSKKTEKTLELYSDITT